jgi:hypothetical protein
MLTAADIARGLGREIKQQRRAYICKCPAHDDRSPSLSVRDADDGRVLVKCHAGCSQADVIDALAARGLWQRPGGAGEPVRRAKPRPAPKDAGDNSAKARALWRRSRPIQGTIAEIYLRTDRRITCALPATLRFLPGNDRYPPAMIAAFGLAHEIEPGVIAINDSAVVAVHLTKLTPDGCKHPDSPNKIMLGASMGAPIVLAPMNDLLGLAITEGIEDALSVYQALGLGAWAAGAAGRLPALAGAVPHYADCITIFEDADTAGTSNAARLADALDARNIAAEILPLAQVLA